MKQATLLIYVKPPRIGIAKTRLAKGLGSGVEARRINTMTLARTMRAALNGSWNTLLYTAPDKELANSLGGLWPAHLERRSQGPGNLGDRLAKGFSEAPAGPVLFIGGDTPDISPALLRQAVRLLKRKDAVFGPTRDGGFWLFGINKSARTADPFGGVRWSSPHAMEDVWANLPESSKVGLLPELIDIDEARDWHVWLGKHEDEVEALTASQTHSAQPEKKKGFFARLFGRG